VFAAVPVRTRMLSASPVLMKVGFPATSAAVFVMVCAKTR